MKTIHLKIIVLLLVLSVSSCQENSKTAPINTTEKTTKEVAQNQIQVIQFHSENRCMTCNKIEALTLETLKSYPELHFQLINVDDAKNEKIAAQFEATGTALFLYNPATQNKIDLTEFAFMTAGNEAQFEEDLKKEIDQFLKG
jgi:thioredoxin-related protein